MPAHEIGQRSESDFSTRGTRGDTVQRSPFDKNGIYQVRPLNTYLRLMNVLREFRPSLRSGRAVKGASLFDGVRGQYLRTKKERGRLIVHAPDYVIAREILGW